MKTEQANSSSALETILYTLKIFRHRAFYVASILFATIVLARWENDVANNVSRSLSLIPCLYALFLSAELVFIRKLAEIEWTRISFLKEVVACLVALFLLAGTCLTVDNGVFGVTFGGATILILVNMNWMATEIKTIFTALGIEIKRAK